MGNFAEGFIQGISWDTRIEVTQCILEAADEEDFQERLTLSRGLFRCDIRAEDGGISERGEPGKSGFFYIRLCEGHLRSALLLRGLYSSHIISIGFSSNVFLIIGIAF